MYKRGSLSRPDGTFALMRAWGMALQLAFALVREDAIYTRPDGTPKPQLPAGPIVHFVTLSAAAGN